MEETPNEPGYTNVPPATPPSTPPYPPPVASSGLSDNTAAALSYITFIPAIIFLVMEPYNKSQFVRFHAFQSIAFCVVSFALHIVLMFIPIVGWILSLLPFARVLCPLDHNDPEGVQGRVVQAAGDWRLCPEAGSVIGRACAIGERLASRVRQRRLQVWRQEPPAPVQQELRRRS
jgi:hypothetical protein